MDKKSQKKKKIMSGKEMYERNPFSSFFFSFILEKRMQKEMTIRGTPFHTVLDLSSNCEVACSLSLVLFFWKKEKKNKPISTACLRPFQKRSLASVHTKKRKFCVGAKRRKVSCRLFIFCWAWQRKRKKEEESPLLVEQFLSKPSVRLQVGHHW